MSVQQEVGRPVQHHPEWCAPGWCEAEVGDNGLVHGDHYGGARPVASTVAVQLALSTTRDDPERLRRLERDPEIVLRIAACEAFVGTTAENKWRQGETAYLEPEEAEMLARRLLEVAAEWRQVCAGQPGVIDR